MLKTVVDKVLSIKNVEVHCQNQALPLTSHIYQRKFGVNQKRKELKETLESVSEMQDEKLWGKDLELMFPSFSIDSIKRAIGKATSLNEATEILCEDATPKEEDAQDPVTYDSIESLVADFSSSMDDIESYTLCTELKIIIQQFQKLQFTHC